MGKNPAIVTFVFIGSSTTYQDRPISSRSHYSTPHPRVDDASTTFLASSPNATVLRTSASGSNVHHDRRYGHKCTSPGLLYYHISCRRAHLSFCHCPIERKSSTTLALYSWAWKRCIWHLTRFGFIYWRRHVFCWRIARWLPRPTIKYYRFSPSIFGTYIDFLAWTCLNATSGEMCPWMWCIMRNRTRRVAYICHSKLRILLQKRWPWYLLPMFFWNLSTRMPTWRDISVIASIIW